MRYITTMSSTRKKPKERRWNISPNQGNEIQKEDLGGSPNGTKTNGEELPMLPKVLVKCKLINEANGCKGKTLKDNYMYMYMYIFTNEKTKNTVDWRICQNIIWIW